MAASFVASAILLRVVPYGEADRVVTLLGRSTGRVSALARSARRSSRRFGGGLGLGARGEATLRERAGADLLSLEGFSVTEPRIALGQDVARAAHAAYALELVDKLCPPRQAEPAVYDWLDALLGRLEAAGASAERLRVFELGLLRRAGLGPTLRSCASCGRENLGDEPGRWHPAQGGVVCAACGGRTKGSVLAPAVRQALARFADVSFEEAEGTRLEESVGAGCRSAVLELLAHHIPGTLKSLEFMAKMAASSAAASAASAASGRAGGVADPGRTP